MSAIEFTFQATSNCNGKLSDYRGKNVVLYFYPKDNTPGCTTESQDFSALYQDFTAHNTVIFGISKDSLASHEKFKAKHTIPFELISDTEETICQQLGVIQLKKFMGKEYMGIVRSTFLLNSTGEIIQQWRGVKVKGHAQAVLEAVETLSAHN